MKRTVLTLCLTMLKYFGDLGMCGEMLVYGCPGTEKLGRRGKVIPVQITI